MYGTTDTGFVKISPTDATVTYIHQEGNYEYPNALTFVPLGTVEPTKEALVGFKQVDGQTGATSYVRIDLTSGAMTTIGDINGGAAFGQAAWQSSGDIIAMRRDGNRAFVTVKPWNPDGGLPDDTGTDSLAEIDPATGLIKTIIGAIGQEDLYGLGQWAGTAYGFNDQGNIIQIDLTSGAGTTLTTLTDDSGAPEAWFGAGVTTRMRIDRAVAAKKYSRVRSKRAETRLRGTCRAPPSRSSLVPKSSVARSRSPPWSSRPAGSSSTRRRAPRRTARRGRSSRMARMRRHFKGLASTARSR